MPRGAHKGKLDTRKSATPSGRKIINDLFDRESSVPIKTGRRPGVSSGFASPWMQPPLEWLGTLPEWAINWAHTQLKRKPGEDFEYIYEVAGGVQVDFFEYDLNLAIQVQGVYWHYEFSGSKVQEDQEQMIRVESAGIQVIAIDEDNALADPVFYLKEALEGRDHSRLGRGVA